MAALFIARFLAWGNCWHGERLRSRFTHSKGNRKPELMLRSLVGMTGPVIQGRAGRTPLPLCAPASHPVSGLPMSVVSFTFAPLHRSSAPICTFALPLLPSCPQVLRPSCPLTRLPCQRVNLPACPLAQARAPSQSSGSPLLPPLSSVSLINRASEPLSPIF